MIGRSPSAHRIANNTQPCGAGLILPEVLPTLATANAASPCDGCVTQNALKLEILGDVRKTVCDPHGGGHETAAVKPGRGPEGQSPPELNDRGARRERLRPHARVQRPARISRRMLFVPESPGGGPDQEMDLDTTADRFPYFQRTLHST